MKRVSFYQSIRLKIIIILTLFLLLAFLVIGTYFTQELEQSLKNNFINNVEERMELLETNLADAFAKERSEDDDTPTLQDDVQSIVNRYRYTTGLFSDLFVVDSQMRVIGTKSDYERLGKRTKGYQGINIALQYDQTDQQIMRNQYTDDRVLVRTVPVKDGDAVVGAIRVEASIEEVYNQVESTNQIFLNGMILAILVSVILGILVARSITKPITEMRKQAMIMATGNFSKKVNVYGTDEIGQLAMTFNEMNDRLKQANQSTEEERRKLSSVLSNMSDGVMATDEHGRISLMNEPAARLIGQSFHDVKGKPLAEVLLLEENIVDLKELEETGSLTIDFSNEDQFFLLKANFSIVQDQNEMFNGLITVISDVTEEEKVERERREFVSNVSHELRTPLTTMRSYLETLSDGAWEDEELAPYFLQVTQNETERMIRLVNDLLQLSRMDQTDNTMNMQQVNVIPFFHDIVDRFEMNKSDNISFKRNIPNDTVMMWLDTDKITQVVDNILSNAMKYSPEGGTITFQVEKQAHRLKVSIIDEGLGIAQEKVDKIFDRFYRVDKARSRQLGGTGLGLAISKEIVESHSGHIWAESQEGQGTTISFTLPLPVRKRGNGQ